MKILLIYPYVLEKRIHEEDVSVVPIGLYYVGALLIRHGYQVRILNGYGLNDHRDRIKETIISYQPDVIGFSVLNANRWGALDIARMAKAVDANVHIVFGGVSATYLWKHFLTHFDIVDFVVLGEGEQTFLKLIQALEGNKQHLLSRMEGLALRVDGQPFRTAAPAPAAHLDNLPDPSEFFTFQHVALTRGCPGKCTFCGSPDFWGRRVRFHSPDYFVGQLERLYGKGVTHFFFCDDTFTLRRDLVIEVCRRIIARRLPITWVAISRVTHVDAEVLKWMRKAGCTQISYGIESGSRKIRKIFAKNITNDQIQTAFELTLRHGILARAYFIYGAPGETEDTISETLELIRKIKPLAAIFYILTLFPGTALYDSYQRKSGLDDDIWLDRVEDILYFETDPDLSREQVLQFGQTLREEYHRRLSTFAAEIDLVDLPELYPFHADFLSRLAMTFTHGDYAHLELIAEKKTIALKLYQKALQYHPDQRAYLGLGVLYQQKRLFIDSVRILEQGIEYFPNNKPLSVCLGISLMNIGEFGRALALFEQFPASDEARRLGPVCRERIATGRR